MGKKRPREKAGALQDNPNAQPAKKSKKIPRTDLKPGSLIEKSLQNLSSAKVNVRIAAAEGLILATFAKESTNIHTVKDVLSKLLQGICSSQKTTRSGFFTALTEFLRQLYESDDQYGLALSISDLIDLVKKQSKLESQNEATDSQIGRVSAYAAIIRSSILFRSEASRQHGTKLLEDLFRLYTKSPSAREESAHLLVGCLKSAKGEARFLSEAVCQLDSNGLSKTPEGVTIWLTISSIEPKAKLPKGVWRHRDPLDSRERESISAILKEASVTGENAKCEATLSHSVNLAWDVVMLHMIQRLEQRKLSTETIIAFSKFWSDLVDVNMCAPSAPFHHKQASILISSKILSTCPNWVLPAIFSPNLMKFLGDQRNNTKQREHNPASIFLHAIEERARISPGDCVVLVSQLLQKDHTNFDQAMKFRVMERILVAADESSLLEISSVLEACLLRSEDRDSKSAATQRRWLADLIVVVVKSRTHIPSVSMDPGVNWLVCTLGILAKAAYLDEDKLDTIPNPNLSSETRSMFHTKLLTCLTHVVSAKSKENNAAYPYLMVNLFKPMLDVAGKTGIVASISDKEVRQLLQSSYSVLASITDAITSSQTDNSLTHQAFRLTMCFSIFQVYSGDVDAASVIEELISSWSPGENSPTYQSDVVSQLTEVTLSFVSRQSAVLRKVGEVVFTSFASNVGRDSLDALLAILQKSENLDGQNELFDADGGAEENDVGNVEIDLDVEVIGGPGNDSEDEASSDEEESEEGSATSSGSDGDEGPAEQESEGDQAELLKFDLLLADALKTGQDGEDDSDEDMDDEQMMALEPHLAKIFKERTKITSRKKENKDAKETILNFKNRVLDLLHIYVKQEHAKPLALDTISPLLRLIRTTTNRQTAEKGFACLKTYFDACKGKELPVPGEGEGIDLELLLAHIHEEASKDGSKMFSIACSRASLFVVRVLVHMDPANYARAVDVYAETQKKWFLDSKSKLQASFFTQWASWSVNSRKREQPWESKDGNTIASGDFNKV
ncbi:hypothetical protein K402DRAFT_455933 [Aulographum hederae CBS 113979]|uniref:DNA polymerase V n=1 Tax=Aulographum hederae CBS 113979 TaxID=1176131 RepID=A0A6G1GU83_9PEZI|nr:hypothetical protein K402DRAFT_455933 [Aulographum hederae CBS 113979]